MLMFTTRDVKAGEELAWNYISDGGIDGGKYCLRGSLTDADAIYQGSFNVSHRCLDPISVADYKSATCTAVRDPNPGLSLAL